MRVLPQDAPPAAILLAVLGSECCNRQAPRSPQRGRRERFSRRHPCSVPVVISDHGSGGNIDASAPVEVSVLAVAVPPLLCLTELLDHGERAGVRRIERAFAVSAGNLQQKLAGGL